MSLTISGKVTGISENHSISSAVVRLYRKDTGALVSATTSDTLGDFSFTGIADFDPYRYFCVAYHADHLAGISDIRKNYINLSLHVYGDLVDSNTDILQIPTPLVNDARLAKIVVESMTSATSTGTLQIRNAANGAGSGITVSLTVGTNKWSAVGDLTTADNFYVRSVTPANGTTDLDIQLFIHLPVMIIPLGLGI